MHARMIELGYPFDLPDDAGISWKTHDGPSTGKRSEERPLGSATSPTGDARGDRRARTRSRASGSSGVDFVRGQSELSVPTRGRETSPGTERTMTVNELMGYLEELDGDAEVRIMMQENWPFECAIRGVVTRDQIWHDCGCDRKLGEGHDEECELARRRGLSRRGGRERRVHRRGPAGAIRQQASVGTRLKASLPLSFIQGSREVSSLRGPFSLS